MKNLPSFEEFINKSVNESNTTDIVKYLEQIEEEALDSYLESEVNLLMEDEYHIISDKPVNKTVFEFYEELHRFPINEGEGAEIIQNGAMFSKMALIGGLAVAGFASGGLIPAMGLATAICSPIIGMAMSASLSLEKMALKRDALKKQRQKEQEAGKKAKISDQIDKLNIQIKGQVDKIDKAKATVSAAKAVAAGKDPIPPKGASKATQAGFAEGKSIGAKAAETHDKLKKLPKEKQKEASDKVKSQVEALNKKGEKLKQTAEKLKKAEEA